MANGQGIENISLNFIMIFPVQSKALQCFEFDSDSCCSSGTVPPQKWSRRIFSSIRVYVLMKIVVLAVLLFCDLFRKEFNANVVNSNKKNNIFYFPNGIPFDVPKQKWDSNVVNSFCETQKMNQINSDFFSLSFALPQVTWDVLSVNQTHPTLTSYWS